MIVDLVAREGAAQLPETERCPICNARVARVLGDGAEYLCGARVVPTTHGSWSIATPCSVGVQAPASLPV